MSFTCKPNTKHVSFKYLTDYLQPQCILITQPNPANTPEWGGNKKYECQRQDAYEGQQTAASQSKSMEQLSTLKQSTNTYASQSKSMEQLSTLKQSTNTYASQCFPSYMFTTQHAILKARNFSLWAWDTMQSGTNILTFQRNHLHIQFSFSHHEAMAGGTSLSYCTLPQGTQCHHHENLKSCISQKVISVCVCVYIYIYIHTHTHTHTHTHRVFKEE